MKKPNLLLLTTITLLIACGTGSKLTIFDIGESRDKVINTIVSEFTYNGEHPTKDKVLDIENGNHITMYDCDYHGQKYKKVRVCYSEEKVRRLELRIKKDEIQNINEKLESDFGIPHRIRLPYIFNTTIEANVFMGENEAVVLYENDDCYEIMVVSGEQRDELNRYM